MVTWSYTREEDDQLELYGEPEDWTAEVEEALALVQQESGGTHKKGRRRSKGSKRRHDYGHKTENDEQGSSN